MKDNPLARIADYGQSVWMDYIERRMIKSGALKRLIEDDGIRGITSNPTIFEKAISGSDDYDEQIRALADQDKSVEEIYTEIVVSDICGAADLLLPVFQKSKGEHGFVSLEVSPHLAHDTEATIKEARRLWKLVDRPNLLIKVPGTSEGLPATRQLIREGINVNVTLLFGLDRYEAVTEAYISGVQDRLKDGKPIAGITSVASFFLSRIDVLIDPILETIIDGKGERGNIANQLHGQVAIASAKIAYQIYLEVFKGELFHILAEQGARPQRVLWASTSTKNPEYSDIRYVEPLIGPETINTMPPDTLDAYRDHGNPADRLQTELPQAEMAFVSLADLNIDIASVTQQLEDEGVQKFIDPYDKLFDSLKEKTTHVSSHWHE